MDIIDLVDRSAEVALAHANDLQSRLRTAGAELGECEAEAHRLVADIVSLRNAAELLKRQVLAGGSRAA